MNTKNCIVHIPNSIDKKATSGSQIRPLRMIEAFKDNGYDVSVVMGKGKERKQQIKEIKKNIESGIKYDFLYSENSTMPTLLTERDHIPRHPFLDFGFWRFAKKKGIPIGLFYRDIYWKFPIYHKEVSLIKRIISIPMYYYDLYQYKKYVDMLYLPSEKMGDYVGVDIKRAELPPGCDYIENEHMIEKTNKNSLEPLKLFYVGGVGELYDLTKLMQTVCELSRVQLVICCRANEWDERKEYYSEYMNERIRIVHASGIELNKYYKDADICMLFFESEGYRNFAMPIKLFEYLANLKPIIATEGSAAGEFVEKNGIGWTIPFSKDILKQLLQKICDDTNILEEKKEKMVKARELNTWKSRGAQVIQNLKKRGKKDETSIIKEN